MRVAIFYGLSSLGTAATAFLISSWLTYFYLPPDGSPLVPAALYGVVVLGARLLGALMPPVVGYWSDRAAGRWGRRIPFMLAAGLPMALFFFMLWTPPVSSESNWNLAYLVIILLLFRAALSLYRIPYLALLPELALDDRHRVRMSAWQSGFLLLGYLLGGLAGPVIDQWGFRTTALFYAALSLVVFYLPVLVIRERPSAPGRESERPDFWQNLVVTIRNPAFLLFALTWALYLMTTTLIQSAVPFIVTEICLLSEADTVLFYIPAVVVSLLCYPLVTWLAGRVGKWKVYAGSLLASALVFPLVMVIGSWLPIGLQAQCVSWAVIQSASISGAVVLSATFIAEITDHDSAVTGQHREGTYYAATKVFEDIFNGLAMALLPWLLLLGRSNESLSGPLGVRLTGLVSGVIMLVAFLFFLRYPQRLAKGR